MGSRLFCWAFSPCVYAPRINRFAHVLSSLDRTTPQAAVSHTASSIVSSRGVLLLLVLLLLPLLLLDIVATTATMSQQHQQHKRSVEVARGLLLEWRAKLGQALGEEGDVVRQLLEQGLKDTEAMVDKVLITTLWRPLC